MCPDRLGHPTIHAHHHHCVWDNAIAPVRTVAPGDTLTFEVNDASAGQITPASTAGVFDDYDGARVNPVTGPIFVDGAEPGDTLIVRLEHYAPSGWGWTAIIPGFGLLTDQFQDAHLRHWSYNTSGSTPLLFGDVAAIPLAPFAGTIGIAPREAGAHSIIPPRRVGGNMDVRDLVAGSVLKLPVEVPGALFSIGDTHAAQGDGEVCGTAIESPMSVVVTLDLAKSASSAMPRMNVPLRAPVGVGGRAIVSTGIGPDLEEAARIAVSEMIDELAREQRLSAPDAYMLCSVVGELRISQIVDAPNWTVSFRMPCAIFD